MASAADKLITQLEGEPQWPPARQVIDRVTFLAGLREADETVLRAVTKWEKRRDYVPDPLPSVIARAHAVRAGRPGWAGIVTAS